MTTKIKETVSQWSEYNHQHTFLLVLPRLMLALVGAVYFSFAQDHWQFFDFVALVVMFLFLFSFTFYLDLFYLLWIQVTTYFSPTIDKKLQKYCQVFYPSVYVKLQPKPCTYKTELCFLITTYGNDWENNNHAVVLYNKWVLEAKESAAKEFFGLKWELQVELVGNVAGVFYKNDKDFYSLTLHQRELIALGNKHHGSNYCEGHYYWVKNSVTGVEKTKLTT